MTTNNIFQVIEGDSWRRGYGQLLAKENKGLWGTRRWLVHSLIWLAVVNGFVALMLFVMPRLELAGEAGAPVEEPFIQGLQAFFQLGAMALAVGVIILAQDAIIGEKDSGTAEWLLSKPVSRAAFVLSKITAHTLAILVIMILLQGGVAYLLLSTMGELTAVAFLKGLGLEFLVLFFYLALTIMMGVLTSNRGLLLAVTLGALLGGQLLASQEPLTYLMPWILPNIASGVALGFPIPGQLVTPVVLTAMWSVLFIAVALWRFEKAEF